MQSLKEIRRNKPPEGAEVVSYTPIENLFILIHPLDAMPEKDIRANNHTKKARSEFRANVKRHFLPRSSKDVLVFIPRIGTEPGDFRRYTRAHLTNEMLFPEWHSGISLYKEMREEAVDKRNVLLGENISLSSVSSRLIEERLRKRGFGIMSDTSIIVGGEYVEDCQIDAIVDLLTIPQVPAVFVDPRVTLGRTDYVKYGKTVEASLGVFGEALIDLGHSVAFQNGYIRVGSLS